MLFARNPSGAKLLRICYSTLAASKPLAGRRKEMRCIGPPPLGPETWWQINGYGFHGGTALHAATFACLHKDEDTCEMGRTMACFVLGYEVSAQDIGEGTEVDNMEEYRALLDLMLYLYKTSIDPSTGDTGGYATFDYIADAVRTLWIEKAG